MVEPDHRLRTAVEADGADWELVLHLVASHHGWCRPLAPPVAIPDQDAERVEWVVDDTIPLVGTTAHRRGRLDSRVVDRFWTLVRKYGWHELAYVEEIEQGGDL
jgi:CRISPR-associated endonuclease/helicase Cas3